MQNLTLPFKSNKNSPQKTALQSLLNCVANNPQRQIWAMEKKAGPPSAQVEKHDEGERVGHHLQDAADEKVDVQVARDEAPRVEGEAVVDEAIGEPQVVHDHRVDQEVARA